METIKYDERELAIRLRDFMIEMAKNNRMKWSSFLKLVFACALDISAQNYADDFDQCKEGMKSLLELTLTTGEKIYGTEA